MSAAELNKHRFPGLKVLWLLFTVFILYGTLIPFNLVSYRELISSNVSNISWVPFVDPDGSRASIPDIVQNILLFFPFGFLGVFSIMNIHMRLRIMIVTALGLQLSGMVEILQLFTSDRTSSLTDLITNTGGALIGALSASIVLETFSQLSDSAHFRQFREDRYFMLVLISCLIVAVGALQPFDFTLDVGIVGSKVKSITVTPLEFNRTLGDEGVVFFRLFLLGYVWSLWLKKAHLKYFVPVGLLSSCFLGIFFELCQVIVKSRMPSIQDAAVIICGSSSGALLAKLTLANISQRVWTIAVILTTWITAGMQVLSPFHLKNKYGGFNVVPFLSYYERTSFIALSNFIESVLMYVPMGFILHYIHAHDNRTFAFIVIGNIGGILSLSLEFPQAWINGRYADITDVLGAIAGAVAGSWICWQWKTSFKRRA